MLNSQGKEAATDKSAPLSAPAISLPKGGGAIRGMGEKFAANPVTGTGSMTVPIATSPGRSGFGLQLSLSYDSGAGNGPFGFGWNLSLPSITRKSDKGLPKYQDAEESDVFILSGAEDLVPALIQVGGKWQRETLPPRTVDGVAYRIQRYRPRIEGLFARIERWTNQSDPSDSFWRSISKDNITTWYGKSEESRIADPADSTRIFSWLICESYDDKGNVIAYRYKAENSEDVDESKAHERNRSPDTRKANRYLKHIRYGNHAPYFPTLSETAPWPSPPGTTALDGGSDWFFEVVFDYGEHDGDKPTPNDVGKWTRRNDPFSTYRASFEVRTYRLCQRVLMFHHFPDEEGVGKDCLVRSTDFTYRYEQEPTDPRNPIHSVLTSVTQCGYKRQTGGGYLKKSLPPVEFEYSQATIHEAIHEVDPESLENLPYGLDNGHYQWVDLDGEGLSGVLTEQAEGWFYKANLSPIPVRDKSGKETVVARFAPVDRVAERPSLAAIASGRQQLLDLAGDGQLDLVELNSPVPGFYERTQDQRWVSFRPFASWPNIPPDDPNLRFVDLTGDGHADIFITEDEAFTWYPSLAEAGFGQAERQPQALDEEKGPRLVLADGTQSVYLTDISGDGSTDLVRIRNGEVCYWPNLGYGRFGAKVTMDNAPWFDAPDQFDQRRIRLADIDGSGVTDIIYLGHDGVQIYFNQSGNSWSDARRLSYFPHVDNLSAVTAVDLLGNGTACLVWSSPLPGDTRRPMRYIDLMGGQKPHLLIKTVNNLGAETRVQYAPSTKFYLADKLAGEPWITKLPFPVHVVERVETYDWISRNRFVTRYKYHHGYFDGEEREFRGFGMVEQFDTEEFASLKDFSLAPAGAEGQGEGEPATNIDEASHVPPVLTKTWFHTGAYFNGNHISTLFEEEYYREGDPSLGESGLADAQQRAMLLPDTVLPVSILRPDGKELPWALSPEDMRQAHRSLKGSILRQEIYALDGSEEEDRPYSASERNYTIEMLQPSGKNKHAVFFTHARETVDFHYERKLYAMNGKRIADPRVSHAVTLAVDYYGNVLRSVAIGYGRRHDDADPLLTLKDRNKQKKTLITYTENGYTNPVLLDDDYRLPLPRESRTYELLKVQPASNLPQVTNLFRFAEMQVAVAAAGDGQHDLLYEDLDAVGALQNAPYRRLIEHVRTLYRPDDLGVAAGDPEALLALGQLEPLALPGESFKLAFTPGLLAQVYKRGQENLLPNPAAVLSGEAGYVDLDQNGNWWIPSGRIFFHQDPNASSTQELAHAGDHFFLPHRFRDPFAQNTTIRYDKYNLLLLETADPLGNKVTVGERDQLGNVTNRNDYRVMQPGLVTDPNGNRSEVAFDALGMLVGTAIMGKASENKGDSLAGYDADLDHTTILAHIEDPLANPHDILKKATTRLVYDMFAYHRTQNDAQPQPAVLYTLARETHDADLEPGQQTRVQHSFSYSDGFGREIQKKIRAELGPLVAGGPVVSPRWVGSGWTIFNNKGKPVRQYEPFFDNTHVFKFGKQVGVSSILFYDPVERAVATLHPNHTYEKVVFDPWRQETWDVNDTVTLAPQSDEDVKSFFLNADGTPRLPADEYLPTWYALRADPAHAAEANQKWPDPKVRDAEKDAAAKAGVHANTPTVAHSDTLGRTFLTVADNGVAGKYVTRVEFDIEGNQRAVIDALGRIVMTYEYDILGNRIHQNSMDAGERWMLNDVAGNPIRAWNSRGHAFRTEYDALRRPLHTFVKGAEPQDPDKEILFERTEYGENQPNAAQLNLRTRIFRQFDGAGVVTNMGHNPVTDKDEAYDFKGNLLRSSRQLAADYKAMPDWTGSVTLAPEVFTGSTTYDALNRPISLNTPDKSEIKPTFNEANLLEKVDVRLRGASEPTPFVKDIDYDAKGQRKFIEYGSGVKTEYEYDEKTFRLINLKTTRPTDNATLQNLTYIYDPVGNITEIPDDAQQTIFFNNAETVPAMQYTYDAIYRLIHASGREHVGQTENNLPQHMPELKPHYDFNDSTRMNLPHPNDWNKMRPYDEKYEYDQVGNILKMIHEASPTGSWTRHYQYESTNNRLRSTSLPGDLNPDLVPLPTRYEYDEHGNMVKMPHLAEMKWDFEDQLHQVNLGGGGTAYHVYDAAGQRVRKVVEKNNGSVIEERIYLRGYEIFRKRNASGLQLERETLHIMDDKQRVALVETKTVDSDSPLTPHPSLIRYQFGNHLGSACLELDDVGAVISYEEYHPYGTTSYQAGPNAAEVSLKRYRYTGKERDEESGFYYHGARYYAPWLGRWVSVDPKIEMRESPFTGFANNPVRFVDESGESVVDDPTHPDLFERYKERVASIKESSREAYHIAKAQARDTGRTPEERAAARRRARYHNLRYWTADSALEEARQLEKSDVRYVIKLSTDTSGTGEFRAEEMVDPGTGRKTGMPEITIIIHPGKNRTTEQRVATLGHELVHAYEYESGQSALSFGYVELRNQAGVKRRVDDPTYDVTDEVRAYQREQILFDTRKNQVIDEAFVYRQGYHNLIRKKQEAAKRGKPTPRYRTLSSVYETGETIGSVLARAQKSRGKQGLPPGPSYIYKGWESDRGEGLEERFIQGRDLVAPVRRRPARP
ncbi:MAG: toxin [Deltaproteobacteria bacterium]|nr:toxin [Deltaproteobacteria bacterium]